MTEKERTCVVNGAYSKEITAEVWDLYHSWLEHKKVVLNPSIHGFCIFIDPAIAEVKNYRNHPTYRRVTHAIRRCEGLPVREAGQGIEAKRWMMLLGKVIKDFQVPIKRLDELNQMIEIGSLSEMQISKLLLYMDHI